MTSKKSKISFLKLLENLDGFGAPIFFNLKKEETHRSSTGGMIFLILCLFSTGYCLWNFIPFVKRENQTLIFSTKVKSDDPVNLTQLNFTFAVGLYDDFEGMDATEYWQDYFDYEARYINWTGFGKGSKKRFNLDLKKCEKKDFNQFNHSFELFNLTKNYCPIFTSNYTNITGVHTDDAYQYVEVSLYVRDEIVKDESKFQKLKQRLIDTPLKFHIYFIDTKLDFENYTDPVTPWINFLAYYIEPDYFNRLAARFSNLDFSTDDNIFYNDPSKKTALIFQDFSMDSSVQKPRGANSNEKYYLARTYLRMSQKYVVCQRTYQKITSYIADMTGILSQLLIVLLFLVGYVNHIGARQKIMHRLMKFKGNKHFDRDLVLKIFEDKIQNILTHESRPNKLFSKNLSASKSLKKIDDSFIDLKSSRERDNLKTTPTFSPPTDFKKMNSFEILMSLCCICHRNWRIKRKIIKKGDKTVEHYLDVLTYLKKMTELDYMKYLMLNHDQLNIFNFIASPMVVSPKLSTAPTSPKVVSHKLSTTPSNNDLKIFFDKEHKQKFTMDKDEIQDLLLSYEKFTNIKEPTSGDIKILHIFASQILKLKNDSI